MEAVLEQPSGVIQCEEIKKNWCFSKRGEQPQSWVPSNKHKARVAANMSLGLLQAKPYFSSTSCSSQLTPMRGKVCGFPSSGVVLKCATPNSQRMIKPKLSASWVRIRPLPIAPPARAWPSGRAPLTPANWRTGPSARPSFGRGCAVQVKVPVTRRGQPKCPANQLPTARQHLENKAAASNRKLHSGSKERTAMPASSKPPPNLPRAIQCSSSLFQGPS